MATQTIQAARESGNEVHELTVSALQIIDDDTPRVRDLCLGSALGFDRPRDARKIIERNLPELKGFGTCATVAHVVRGNPVVEYWLTEEQALLVTMFSRTSRAAEARREIIRVFMDYRRGLLERPVHVRAHNRAKPSKYATEARRRRTSVAVPNLDAYGWSKIALLSLGMLALIDEQKADQIAALVATDTRDRNLALTAAQNVAMYRQLDEAHASALTH